jgi:beta-1,4-N-acetylglucosaminyltransferase
VFVTVGSTSFDSLVLSVLSQPFLRILHAKGHTKLVVQCGNCKLQIGAPAGFREEGVEIEIWRFKDSLEAEYGLADLVISHAGKVFYFTVSL